MRGRILKVWDGFPHHVLQCRNRATKILSFHLKKILQGRESSSWNFYLFPRKSRAFTPRPPSITLYSAYQSKLWFRDFFAIMIRATTNNSRKWKLNVYRLFRFTENPVKVRRKKQRIVCVSPVLISESVDKGNVSKKLDVTRISKTRFNIVSIFDSIIIIENLTNIPLWSCLTLITFLFFNLMFGHDLKTFDIFHFENT